MHRLIVTSATYRQSSRVTPDRLERDPYNRLFSRGPRFRMEAEMVRDQALALSGLLEADDGRPERLPLPARWDLVRSVQQRTLEREPRRRPVSPRSLHILAPLGSRIPRSWRLMPPAAKSAASAASRTNTPLQALATLNDPAFVQPAAALAWRILAEFKGPPEDRACHAFRLVLARMPKPAELGHLVKLYHENLNRYRGDPAAALAIAKAGLVTMTNAEDSDKAALAAWTIVANVLLNLDETLTKG